MKSSLWLDVHKVVPSDEIIGFWGYVSPEMFAQNRAKFPNAKWVDLDIDHGCPQAKIIPDASCKIIKNIFDNSFYLKGNIIKILAPVGKDKCDSAFFASVILKDYGFNVETFEYINALPHSKLLQAQPKTPICESNLPLREKVELITAQIIEPDKKSSRQPEKCEPRFGFWGVPPDDLSILELFPDNTHVFGWCRCVEAKSPANIELELKIPPDLPVIFYAQTFCAKNELAKFLADKHNGLYIDVDGQASKSTTAKIEAFLQLR